MDAPIEPNAFKDALDLVDSQLALAEEQVCRCIISELKACNPKRDRRQCDRIFGIFTSSYLAPCLSKDLASRAAGFSGGTLVPTVLDLEKKLATEFHKGALFHDTAVAYLLSGDEVGYEFFLAMTDEEEVRTTKGAHQRGTINLRDGGIAKQTLADRLQFACDLLNGGTFANAASFGFLVGAAALTVPQLDAWRKSLDAQHQFELLRIVHDIEAFVGVGFPKYSFVEDNPFILLRLAKALSHLAQWVESCLTHWQVPPRKTLRDKLLNDPDFGARLIAAAGGRDSFAGNNPTGPNIESELRQLLNALAVEPIADQRNWRILRTLYIVRNSTAHTISANAAIYRDKQLLMDLLQVVFVSVFVVCQLKMKPMP